MNRHAMKTTCGFTLVELMVTLAVAAILIAMATPSFRELMMNNRLTVTTNDFVGAANLARSEAIKRGLNASVCISNDGATCSAGTQWNVGWIVWFDANNSGTPDAGEIVRVAEGFANTNVGLTGTQARFTYNSAGVIATPLDTLDVCDNRTGETGRRINFSQTGRIEVTRNFICP